MSYDLARKFQVEVTTDLTLAGGWLVLGAIDDFSSNVTPNLEDASSYDTDGYASYEKTFEEWVARTTFKRRATGGVHDAGQELVRGRTVGQWGDACRIGVRWFDRFGGPEAYQGVAIVTWERGQTGVKNLDTATVTFTGTDVPLVSIANPGVAATKPVLLSATPSGAAQGELVQISGSGFQDASAVKFGATNAADFSIVSAQLIVASMPAWTAGSAAVTVTNGVGVSDALAYTRGA